MATLGKVTGGAVRPRPLRKTDALELRDTIRRSAGQLVGRLGRHAMGREDMQATQVKAAQVLLGKILPDMTASEVTVIDPAAGMTEAQLLEALARALSGAPQEVRMAVLGAITGIEGRTIEHQGPAETADEQAKTAEQAESVVPRPPLSP